jgi:hypothetical protein
LQCDSARGLAARQRNTPWRGDYLPQTHTRLTTNGINQSRLILNSGEVLKLLGIWHRAGGQSEQYAWRPCACGVSRKSRVFYAGSCPQDAAASLWQPPCRPRQVFGRVEADAERLQQPGQQSPAKHRSDDQDERSAAWVGQFGTTSAPRWPHCVHTKRSPSDLMGVSSGRWPTFMIVL